MRNGKKEAWENAAQQGGGCRRAYRPPKTTTRLCRILSAELCRFSTVSTITNRFSVGEIIGKTVIIHDRLDDFTTQTSGNSGTKIACGVIRGAKGTCPGCSVTSG
ncbi:MAG: superoxide dismutase family protein [Muribaculaceae bacterium]|nr:superoxide dismutase family protein [Muribaculaceae bacterium]